jgi:hypothetical protein
MTPYRIGLGIAVVLLVAVVVLPLGAKATGSSGDVACLPDVRDGVLPVWMRGGFGPNPRTTYPTTTYALGRQGAIGAVLWGATTLNSPPAENRNNKILWVPRRISKSVMPLWIKMQKMDGTRLIGAPVRRIITTGPGPSLVDAPSAGCWRLTLTWSGRSDTLDLAYAAPTS